VASAVQTLAMTIPLQPRPGLSLQIGIHSTTMTRAGWEGAT